MSRIAHDFFASSHALMFPAGALVLFVSIFVIVAIRAARAERSAMDSAARMPLSEDSHG